MCSTRLLSDILLIATAQSKLFGATPKDESRFHFRIRKVAPEMRFYIWAIDWYNCVFLPMVISIKNGFSTIYLP